jgi:hypothetical protein
VEAGTALTETEWRLLRESGVTGSARDEAEAALAAGDAAAAARVLREALRRAGEGGGPARTGPAALDSPTWDPRFDRVVKEYFAATPR